MLVCLLYAIVALLFMLILQKICFYKEAVLRCFMLISLFFTSSKKGDNSSNRMGGPVRSKFQEVLRINELEVTNASFMISLHFFFFIIDYAVFTKIMVNQSSNIIWFYDSWSLSFPFKEGRGSEK